MTATGVDTSFTDVDYPALYVIADEASKAGRHRYTLLIHADLALLAIAAVTGGIGSGLSSRQGTILAVIAAILLIATLMLKFTSGTLVFERDWYDGRALTEQVKTAVWRYMTQVDPFVANLPAVDEKFIASLRGALDAHADVRQVLDKLPSDPQQITARMRQVRSLPWEDRKRVYRDRRLVDQLNWYRGKAHLSTRSALRWYWVGIIGRGAALIFAIVRIAAPNLPSLIAVFTAIAAAATAWNQLGRHEELSKTYALAAQDLIGLNTLLEESVTEEDFEHRVLEVESTISREHSSWVTKRPG